MFPSIRDNQMFPSITDADVDDRPPKSSFPWLWVGFLFAGVFFVVGVAGIIAGVDESSLTGVLILIGLAGGVYWLFCVHRIHKILAEMTNNRYPISPNEAALRHLIPFFNLYWIFHWPGEVSQYINRRGRVQMLSGTLIGLMLLFSMLLRFVDGSIGLACMFGVTIYISAKVRKHAKAVTGILPGELPPLPDPKIFSRPVEATATGPAPEVERSSAG